MRALFILFCAAVLLTCCSREHPEEKAAQAAKECYDLLLQGKYDDFIARKAQTDSIPDSYREQLVANIKMFAAQMEREHRGMKEVRIVDCTADTASHSANAFLVICFGDSTIEETVVPMVERQGQWLMK